MKLEYVFFCMLMFPQNTDRILSVNMRKSIQKREETERLFQCYALLLSGSIRMSEIL